MQEGSHSVRTMVLVGGALCVAGLVGGLVLVQQDPLTPEGGTSCAPVSQARAEAATDRFLEKYADVPDPVIHGAGHQPEGDGFVILAMRSRTIKAEQPVCFEGVPVRYLKGGPASFS